MSTVLAMPPQFCRQQTEVTQNEEEDKNTTRDYKKLKAIEGNRGYSVVGN
jgi:hypothetical protein